MLKVVKANPEKVNGTVIDDIIVERESKAGDTVFNIMLEEKNLSLSAGFIGGKKFAFVTAPDLETMQESIEAFNIKVGTPVKGFRIVYLESVDSDKEDAKDWNRVPLVTKNEEGELVKEEGQYVTSEGIEVYRKSVIVASNDPLQDIMLPHDNVNEGSGVSAEAIASAAKTAVK